MSKNNDLVRRLRERDADWQKQCDGWFSNPDFASTETEAAVRRTLYCEAADEIERLRRDFTEQLERAETLTCSNIDLVSEQEKLLAEIERLEASNKRLKDTVEIFEESNKALREGLKGTLDAWEMLSEGHHRIHVIQSWLVDNMQPAIARIRSLLSKKA